ncbi:MAG: hypothetical protein FGM14_04710 [Flavobacteriales bacterium]|nr:hypothetical protein [Flavobacteriales bacterium]
MNKLQFLVFALLLMLSSNIVLAQDTTRFEVYDVIYMKDNRILKGQILSYDSQLGGISFKDVYGRVYNFSREEYKYFLEKQNFPIKVKKQKGLIERKSNGIRFSLALNTSYFYGLEKSDSDDLNSRRDTQGLGIGLAGTIGKYFTRTHFLGGIAELGVMNNQQYYNVGARYNFEYDNKKTNLAMYVPIELKYQSMFLENAGIPYTETTENSSYSGYYFPKTEFSTVLISVGHGFGFMLKQGGSFNIELAYQRHLTLSQKFYNLKPVDATDYDPKFQVNGFRLGFSFSF